MFGEFRGGGRFAPPVNTRQKYDYDDDIMMMIVVTRRLFISMRNVIGT